SARELVGWFGQAAYFTVPAASLGVRYDSTFWGTVNGLGAGGPGASGAGVFDPSGRLVGTVVRGIEDAAGGGCPAASPPAPSQATASTLSTAFAGIFSSTADPVSTTGAVTIQSVLDPAHSGAQTIDGRKSPITIAFTSPSGGNDTGRLVSLSWIASG